MLDSRPESSFDGTPCYATIPGCRFTIWPLGGLKEVLAWQIAEAMRQSNLSRKRLAEKMKTSRSQVGRLLDPKDGNVTLATLQRAAAIVGRKLRLELV
jgi:predicted XRE-type DNA-binding protein